MQLQVIEVLIGLVAAYFIVSIVASAIVEIGSTLGNKRSHDLWVVINAMVNGGNGKERKDSDIDLTKTSVYSGLQAASRRKRQSKPEDDLRQPSYMSARAFADAVVEALGELGDGIDDVDELIRRIPDGPLRGRVTALRKEFGDDLTLIKSGLETWFDDSMDRLEGAYKRWTQWVLLAVGLVVAVALNVSTIRIVDSLWNDPVLRTAVADSTAATVADLECPEVTTADGPDADGPDAQRTCTPGEKIEAAIGDLDDLQLPVGWNADWQKESGAFWTLAGLLPTALAVMLGAPFWFDLLTRLTGARTARGVPPRAGQDPGSATTEVLVKTAGAVGLPGRRVLDDLVRPPAGPGQGG